VKSIAEAKNIVGNPIEDIMKPDAAKEIDIPRCNPNISMPISPADELWFITFTNIYSKLAATNASPNPSNIMNK